MYLICKQMFAVSQLIFYACIILCRYTEISISPPNSQVYGTTSPMFTTRRRLLNHVPLTVRLSISTSSKRSCRRNCCDVRRHSLVMIVLLAHPTWNVPWPYHRRTLYPKFMPSKTTTDDLFSIEAINIA